MELLGYSTDELLVGALKKRVEWDVSGEVDASPQAGMARVQQLMVEKLLPQDPVFEDNEGMECAIRKFLPLRSQAATRYWLKSS
jgi:hypothetical protein